MSNKKRKVEIEVLGVGYNNKKGKFTVQDPFAGRFGEVSVEIHNMTMKDICYKLFDEGEKAFKYEIKSYKSELNGYAKTVCGETRFIEDSKVVLVITYEKEKKDEMTELLTSRFPSCIYCFK